MIEAFDLVQLALSVIALCVACFSAGHASGYWAGKQDGWRAGWRDCDKAHGRTDVVWKWLTE